MADAPNKRLPIQLPSRVIVRKIQGLGLSEEDEALIRKAGEATGTVAVETQVEAMVYLVKRLEQSTALMKELIQRLEQSSKKVEHYTMAVLIFAVIQILIMLLSLLRGN
jgi:hypothetical protein